jgi:hypothetical protein
MFDVCTMGDTAHIDTIFKFLPHTRQHRCIDILQCCNDPCLKARYSSLLQWPVRKGTDHWAVKNIDAPMLTRVARTWISYRCVSCQPWCTHRTSLLVKKNFFCFPVAAKNSIKVGPLVFLLKILVITENIMKRPVYYKEFTQFCPRMYVTPLRKQVSYVFGQIDDLAA